MMRYGNTAKYIIISDVHGGYVHTLPGVDSLKDVILPWLVENGWTVKTHRTGHMYLSHPKDILLNLGDSVDRGVSNLEVAELFYGSHIGNEELGLPISVISLLGNHDYRIKKKFILGQNVNSEEFLETENQLRKNPKLMKKIIRWVDSLPHTYNSKHFRAAHAMFSKNPQDTMYGKTDINLGNLYFGRIPWWLDYSGKLTFFGHYHMHGEWVDVRRNSVCVDNWDAGLFTVGIVYENGHSEVVMENI